MTVTSQKVTVKSPRRNAFKDETNAENTHGFGADATRRVDEA